MQQTFHISMSMPAAWCRGETAEAFKEKRNVTEKERTERRADACTGISCAGLFADCFLIQFFCLSYGSCCGGK